MHALKPPAHPWRDPWRALEMEAPQQGGGGGGGGVVLEGPGGAPAPLSPPLSPASAAAAALANSRWTPTKEQVAVLEGLYEHGLRTPSAEQIKQITARLREHGHIEGKNVFYWFQNHKARQRQKQKQDSFAYFTRLLRRPPPLPVLVRPPGPPPYRLPVPAAPAMTMAPPPAAAAAAACNSSNGGTHAAVMYRAPFYMPAPQAPAASAGYYHTVQEQQQQQMLLHHQHQQWPVMYPRMPVAQDKMIPAAAPQPLSHPGAAAAPGNASSAAQLHVVHLQAAGGGGPSRETLQLFPLQPTFLLPDKGRAGGGTSASTASASFSGEAESPGSPDSDRDAPAVPFYDFFGLQSGGR